MLLKYLKECFQRDDLFINLLAGEKHREKSTSKTALTKLGEDMGFDTSDIKFPHPQVSLSHSHGMVCAFGVTDAQGVGVDIEQKRTVKLGIQKFFLTQEEQGRFKDKLKKPEDLQILWTIKEAVFKADLANSERKLKDYRIDSFANNLGIASCLNTGKGFSFVCYTRENLLCTFALADLQ